LDEKVKFLLHDIAIYVQAVSIFCSGFKSKNNRAIVELILKILTGKNGGHVLVHWSPNQKVKQCTQYIRSPTKK